MGTISKVLLSGSNQGKPILVAATGTTGTTIHTTLASSTTIDEVWLYATNSANTQTNLTIEYGATGTGNEVSVGIPSRSGLSIVCPGTILTGDGATGSTISAFASVANVVGILGYVNRITP